MKDGMNVLSLFDGISCGMVALERAEIPVKKYISYEIDKYAIQVSKKNYPQIEQCGDVTVADFTQYKGFDLLIGGSPCFVAGTKVITVNGYKNIEDLKVGDLVLTHKNHFKPVVDTGGEPLKDIYELKTQGFLPVECTENHPFYVKRNKDSEPEKMQLKDLKKGYYIGSLINNKNENIYNLSDEMCWILGRYVADGHIRKTKRKGRKNSYIYQCILSIGSDKVSQLKEKVVNHHFSCYSHTQSVHRVVFSSKEIVDFIEANGFGKAAKEKTIPMFILNLPNDKLSSFLDGYMSGDGCIIGDKYQATTISKELAMTLCLAIQKVYRVGCQIYHTKRPPKHIIQGRTVNQNDTYMIRFTKDDKKCKWFIEDDIVWYPIKEINNTNKKENVYNIEVQDDHTYTSNNMITFNCQNLSVYKTSSEEGWLGLEGNKSNLFFHYVRALKECKPKYFLLENVASMEKKWVDVISEELGVQPIMINSSLVSASERKRLYWTNIPNVTQPEDKGIVLKDIVIPAEEVPEKYWYTDRPFQYNGDDEKVQCTILGKGFMRNTREVYNLKSKTNTLLCDGSGGNRQKKVYQDGRCRKLMPIEYERLQTLPDNYTDCISDSRRYTAIGNGWTVDIIAHILSGLKNNNN